MAIICVFLLVARLLDSDYSNFFTWENIFDLLLPIALLYIFSNRYLKEKNKVR
jgi:hypothetical protein